MDNTPALSQYLQEWLSLRAQWRHQTRRKETARVHLEETEDWQALRRRTYDCEWGMLNLDLSVSQWEKVLDQDGEDGLDRHDALALRDSFEALNWMGPQDKGSSPNMRLVCCWFIPYAIDVGEPPDANAPWPLGGLTDHGRPLLDDLAMSFRHALAVLPHDVRQESQLLGRSVRAKWEFCPLICAEGLRDFIVPPTEIPLWPEAAAHTLAFPTTSAEQPRIRAGCVGVTIAAPDYTSLAAARDLLMVRLMASTAQLNGPHQRFGLPYPKEQALAHAEMMQWDLNVEHVLEQPLALGSDRRHISLTVFRQAGVPVEVFAQWADCDGEDGEDDLGGGTFRCRLDSDGMLEETLVGLQRNARDEVSWSVHHETVPDPTPGAGPPDV